MLIINENIKQFEKIINRGYDICNNIWPINKILEFGKCTGYSKNGRCKIISNNRFKITINENLIYEEDILEVVVHEILHTYPNCFNHKTYWLEKASQIKKLHNIKVQRCNSFAKRIKEEKPNGKEYYFECFNCNTEWTYHKRPKWYKDIEHCRCPHCKTYSIVEIKKGESICL